MRRNIGWKKWAHQTIQQGSLWVSRKENKLLLHSASIWLHKNVLWNSKWSLWRMINCKDYLSLMGFQQQQNHSLYNGFWRHTSILQSNSLISFSDPTPRNLYFITILKWMHNWDLPAIFVSGGTLHPKKPKWCSSIFIQIYRSLFFTVHHLRRTR